MQQKRVNCKCSVKQKYKQQTAAAEAATTNHRQTNRRGDKRRESGGVGGWRKREQTQLVGAFAALSAATAASSMHTPF